MKRYRLLTAIFLLLFIGGGIFNFARRSPSAPQDTEREPEALRAILPEARSFLKRSDPFPYYKAFKTTAQTERDLVGFVFSNTDIVLEIR
ncbi:MAG TPA: hypothetical protein PKV41_03870, partial [Candidatus Omnitrophota bacterium]|nr:hypothetical protein [Candidatus Omnitrophota bacterium]